MGTNKEMFNMDNVRATNDNVGDWYGQEQLAAKNFNKIQDALYEAAPDEYYEQLYELLKSAWDYWGSRDALLTVTKKQISEYVTKTIEG